VNPIDQLSAVRPPDSVNFTSRRHLPAAAESREIPPRLRLRRRKTTAPRPTIVDYVNIRWVDEWCKRCNICVEICPKDSLILTHDAIIEATDCIRCGLCERYCPDLAIEVLPKRDENGKLPARGRGRRGRVRPQRRRSTSRTSPEARPSPAPIHIAA
jgi:2-oxoglutarate ferredoxin oxidoreductase subunit delta